MANRELTSELYNMLNRSMQEKMLAQKDAGGTRNLPGVGVLQPQYQPEDITNGWVNAAMQGQGAPAPVQQVQMQPLDIDAVSMTQAAPARVQAPKVSKSKMVPMKAPVAPVSPYADLMKQMEAQLAGSKADSMRNMQGMSTFGQGMAGIDPQLDLSGAYNWINNKTGSTYQNAPDRFAERQALIEKMTSAIPAEQKGVRAQDMEMLKTKLGMKQAEVEGAAKAKEASLDRQLKMQIANMDMQAKLAATSATKSPGQNAMDTAYAKQHVAYQYGGGKELDMANIKDLRTAAVGLRKAPEGDLSGGPVSGMKWMREIYNKESVKYQQMIEGVQAQNLKKILGGAFSQPDREFFLQNQYNQALSQADNATRAENVANRLEQIARNNEQQSKYFMANNASMKGFGENGSDSVSTQQAAPMDIGAFDVFAVDPTGEQLTPAQKAAIDAQYKPGAK